MIIQCTLMTCHKGMDLHAETASRVMRRDIPGGDRLLRLSRAEFHSFWRDPEQEPPERVERLLDIGRFYNPNKHHYGHFERPAPAGPWFAPGFPAAGNDPGADWPGTVLGTDWPEAGTALFDRLGGGAPGGEGQTVDVCVFPKGESGPLISGVFWRLLISPAPDDAQDPASRLIVSRGVDSGLLVNPHMHNWLISRRS